MVGWSTGAPVLLEQAGLKMETASQGPKCARNGEGDRREVRAAAPKLQTV